MGSGGGRVLPRGWQLGVAVASVGLSVLYLTPRSLGIHLPGPTVLPSGLAATFAGVLGVPRLALSVLFLAALWRWRSGRTSRGSGDHGGWASPSGRVLARAGGSSFGPSTVGAVASVAAGPPGWWLIAFLLGIVGAARSRPGRAGGWELHGETPVRYGQLAAGGFLMGRATGSPAAATSGTGCPARRS